MYLKQQFWNNHSNLYRLKWNITEIDPMFPIHSIGCAVDSMKALTEMEWLNTAKSFWAHRAAAHTPISRDEHSVPEEQPGASEQP